MPRPFESIATGVDQVDPLKVSALPLPSIAAERAVEGQETELRATEVSTLTGCDHAAPS
ncbi:MAG TPA: hypothetical protein VKU92_13330 [Acidimicrobiales bacterium]|nr:hypothetical protein [Acidimicrobiales bacterium]